MEQSFKCKICMETLIDKEIYSCRNCYNLLCSKCADEVDSCPFCPTAEDEFAERNIAVERILATSHFTCSNKSYGCRECVDIETKEKHEKMCQYYPFQCPFKFEGQDVCWIGDTKGLRDHISENHQTTTIREVVYTRPVITFLPQTGGGDVQEKVFSVFVHSKKKIFFCRMTMSQNNLIIGIARVQKNNDADDSSYGINLTVGTSLRKAKRNFLINKYYEEHTFTSQFLLSFDNKLLENKVKITLDILELRSILPDGMHCCDF